MVEVSEYHPPKKDIGEPITEGEYIITNIEFEQTTRYGPCAIIHTENAKYHTFSKVLINQLGYLNMDENVKFPIKIMVVKVKSPLSKRTYLTLA